MEREKEEETGDSGEGSKAVGGRSQGGGRVAAGWWVLEVAVAAREVEWRMGLFWKLWGM